MHLPQPQAQTRNGHTPLIPGGYVLLARKLRSSEVMASPALVLKLWVWMLLEASYKEHGHLKRGQFFTSLKDIQGAMAYKIGFRTVKPSMKKVRGAMKVLVKNLMISTMKVAHGQIISIWNYDLYQNPKNYEGHNEGQKEGHTEGTIPTIKEEERKQKKNPSAISSEISVLVSNLFPGEETLFEEVIKAISSTRKTKKVSSGVILSLLKNFEKYPQEKIWAGARTYLSREYWKQGKDEKYLLGIVRNHRPKETNPPQEFKSTGSPLLDRFYRRQAERGQA